MQCSKTDRPAASRVITACATAAFVLAARAASAEIALTVYNDDLALVRETRKLSIASGDATVEVTDVPALIDPTSVHFRSITSPDRALVLEQNFVYDLAEGDRLLERYLDKQVQVFTRQGGSFTGILRSFSGGTIVVAEAVGGRTTIVSRSEVESVVLSGQDVDLVTRPTLVWSLSNSGAAEQTVEIEYLTNGVSWHAEYTGLLNKDETGMELAAWVSLDNRCGKTFENAQLNVVAGSIHRAEQKRPMPEYMGRTDMAMAAPAFESREFFEYHLYALQRRTTVRDRESKQVSLFPNSSTKVEKRYVYDSRRDGERVEVSIVFQNRESAGLGIPLPAGVIRMYKDDGAGGVGLVGEDRIEHTPKDEEVKVVVGKAFDIVAERTQTGTRQLSDRVREESYEIRLRNHKSASVEIVVSEPVWGDWELVKSSVPPSKKTARDVEFRVTVPPDDEATLTYTALISW